MVNQQGNKTGGENENQHVGCVSSWSIIQGGASPRPIEFNLEHETIEKGCAGYNRSDMADYIQQHQAAEANDFMLNPFVPNAANPEHDVIPFAQFAL